MSIITNDEIKIIIKRYNIGKRPLSIILGLGEVTITRYLSDDSKPNGQISDILYSVLNNPDIYLDYLEMNKDKISTIAYGKSKSAVLKLLNLSEETDDVLDTVAQYIVEHNLETTNLSLQKLLYYCQLFNYVIFNKPMFKSTCSAWEHGPVFEEVYYKYKVNGNNPIKNNSSVSIDLNTKKVVDAVIDNFGCFSGAVLCYFTHSELPWKNSYYEGVSINNEDLEAFSFKIKEKYQINNISDIENYAKASIENFKKNRGDN